MWFPPGLKIAVDKQVLATAAYSGRGHNNDAAIAAIKPDLSTQREGFIPEEKQQ